MFSHQPHIPNLIRCSLACLFLHYLLQATECLYLTQSADAARSSDGAKLAWFICGRSNVSLDWPCTFYVLFYAPGLRKNYPRVELGRYCR